MNGPVSIRFLLFAHVRNYLQIPDLAMPQYIERFLGGMAGLLRGGSSELEAPLVTKNTGDTVLFVFDNAADAGSAALAIRDWLKREPFWLEGMPTALSVRIGIHAGPVLESRDPVSGGALILGSHLNRAAGIEPITGEGQVFASREFAALAAIEERVGFRCLPQGLADLPAGMGRTPVYRLEHLPTVVHDQ